MGVTDYFTMNGALMGETGPNGTMYYHTDALGSVTMTTDQSSNVLNTYRYKPYGTQLSKTGTAPDPKFTWVGSLGYRTTGLSHSEYYVRARHYGKGEGTWVTVPPLTENRGRPFAYVLGMATTIADPSGLPAIPQCVPDSFDVTLGNIVCQVDQVGQNKYLLKVYREAIYHVRTACPAGSALCTGCSFKQKRRGAACRGGTRTEYDPNWVDDSPTSAGQWQCGNATPCVQNWYSYDSPGWALTGVQTYCPVQLTHREVGPFNSTDFPLEFNYQFETWAYCHNTASAETVIWSVVVRVTLDSAGNANCDEWNPSHLTCATW